MAHDVSEIKRKYKNIVMKKIELRGDPDNTVHHFLVNPLTSEDENTRGPVPFQGASGRV